MLKAIIFDWHGVLEKPRLSMFGMAPDESLWKLLPELKKKYKLGILSDIAGGKIKLIREKINLTYFDQVFFSEEYGGLNKSDNPEFFLKIAEALGSRPEECLFVDDSERHIETAKKLGFKTCLFSKAGDLEDCLKKLS